MKELENKLNKIFTDQKVRSRYLSEQKIMGLIMEQIKEFEKGSLTDFLDFLLKEGYCDTDVYCEPPTAIDQYLILNKKK